MKNGTHLTCLTLLLGVFLWNGCKKEEPQDHKSPVASNPVVWEYNRTAYTRSSCSFIYNKFYIQSYFDSFDIFKVQAFTLDSGQLVWSQTDFPTDFDPYRSKHAAQEKNVIVFSFGNLTLALDAENGQKLWEETLEHSITGVTILGNYVYKSNSYNEVSSLYRFNLFTGNRELVFAINSNDHGDGIYTPYLDSPAAWKNTKNEDCLILSNRSRTAGVGAGTNRLDLLCWNLSTLTMEWYKKGNDNTHGASQPLTDLNKAYFMNQDGVIGVDPNTGETLWQMNREPGDNDEGDFLSRLILTDGVLFAQTDDNWFYGIDPTTGQKLWSYNHSLYLTLWVSIHNNVVWFTNGGLWALDLQTGQTILSKWRRPAPDGYWGNPIVHHPTLNYLYTCDGRNIYCLDKSKMF